jgi:hypothetical protein
MNRKAYKEIASALVEIASFLAMTFSAYRHCETSIIRIKQPQMTVGVYCNVIASLRSNPENQHITKTRHWQERSNPNWYIIQRKVYY